MSHLDFNPNNESSFVFCLMTIEISLLLDIFNAMQSIHFLSAEKSIKVSQSFNIIDFIDRPCQPEIYFIMRLFDSLQTSCSISNL